MRYWLKGAFDLAVLATVVLLAIFALGFAVGVFVFGLRVASGF